MQLTVTSISVPFMLQSVWTPLQVAVLKELFKVQLERVIDMVSTFYPRKWCTCSSKSFFCLGVSVLGKSFVQHLYKVWSPLTFECDGKVYFAYPRIEVFRFKLWEFQFSLLNRLMFFKCVSPTSGLTRLLYLYFLFHSKQFCQKVETMSLLSFIIESPNLSRVTSFETYV